ncbi:MAG: MBL fold metallo-hydrolase [Rikenellaceae bacterium]
MKSNTNSITFLGTGSSQGVPMIGCNCEVCRSTDYRDKRLRSSVMIKIGDKATIIIDSGMDFRWQMLRENIKKIDGIVFTHSHKDHIGGLDDVRAFNYFQKKDVDIYGEERVNKILLKDYDYAFSDHHYPGIPEIAMHTISTETFTISGVKIEPIRVYHARLPILGFKIENICYITDANRIEDSEIEKIKGVEILVLNALRLQSHISHFSLNEALEMVEKIAPKRTYLTHCSHQLGRYEQIAPQLPENVFLAYDGLKVFGKL